MRPPAWSSSEDNILRKYAKDAPPQSTYQAFWAAATAVLNRSPGAILNRARQLYLYSNTLYGAESRGTCKQCSEPIVKRQTGRVIEDLCQHCVVSARQKTERYKCKCTHCGGEFRGGRRRRVCDPCRTIDGKKRARKGTRFR